MAADESQRETLDETLSAFFRDPDGRSLDELLRRRPELVQQIRDRLHAFEQSAAREEMTIVGDKAVDTQRVTGPDQLDAPTLAPASSGNSSSGNPNGAGAGISKSQGERFGD